MSGSIAVFTAPHSHGIISIVTADAEKVREPTPGTRLKKQLHERPTLDDGDED
jgi:hypothetical protein